MRERGWFQSFLRSLVEGKRASTGQHPDPDTIVLDSQSVRSALSDSEKGIDGNKRTKGIKRQVAVDSDGYVIGVTVTKANVHDSKGAIPVLSEIIDIYRNVGMIKADLGYALLRSSLACMDRPVLDCVKSDFGTPDFIPIQGRWVVERTFSWMDNYRRLTRNYERLLKLARQMFIAGCVFFMLRYFA